jgi:hypothetical protein
MLTHIVDGGLDEPTEAYCGHEYPLHCTWGSDVDGDELDPPLCSNCVDELKKLK